MTYEDLEIELKDGFVTFSIIAILFGMEGKTFLGRLLYFICWMAGWVGIMWLFNHLKAKLVAKKNEAKA
jgi:uncharacterized membrane protein YuzA (DUF378 family)